MAKLTKEELTESGKTLKRKGFVREAKLLSDLAKGKQAGYLLVADAQEMGELFDRSVKGIFLDKQSAIQAQQDAICKKLRKTKTYLFYHLAAANRAHKQRSVPAIGKKMSEIFGTDIQFTPEDFRLPRSMTDEQILAFAKYIGYQPYAIKKILIEV